VDEAREILSRHERERLQDFHTRLQSLMVEYNVALTASFVLFNQPIDPPIRVIPAPAPAPEDE
jgi:hypothetical protein